MPGLVPQNDLPENESSIVPNDDLPQGGAVPENDLPNTESKYDTLPQQALTAVEGAGQGLIGPGAPLIEKGLSAVGVPGLTPEDIKGRAEENPVTHGVAEYGTLAGSLLGGVGLPGLIERGAAAAAEKVAPKVLGKYGQSFIKNAISAGLLRTGNKITDSMLGQGDPEESTAAALAGDILPTALTGGLFGVGATGVGVLGSKALSKMADTEMARKAGNYAIGMGIAENMKQLGRPLTEAEQYINEINALETPNRVIGEMLGEIPKISYGDVKPGINAVQGLSKTAAQTVGGAVGGGLGGALGSMGGTQGTISGTIAGGEVGKNIAMKTLSPLVEKIIGKPISKSIRLAVPGILKAISEGEVNNLSDIIEYAKRVSEGSAKMDNAVNGLFKTGGQMLMDYRATDKQRDKLSDFLENGGINKQIREVAPQPQGMAGGGEVQPQNDTFSTVFPNQAMLLSAAKTRVSQYLDSKRPVPPQVSFPYDKYEPDKVHDKSYRTALGIAASPLSVFNHIKDGTIDAEHIQHLTSLYPELYKQLTNRVFKQIANNKIEDEKPDYKTRMGLSLFLGQPMDTTFSPMAIQQAQLAQMKAPSPMQGPQQKKGSPAKLKDKNANAYKTPGQAGEEDQAKRG